MCQCQCVTINCPASILKIRLFCFFLSFIVLIITKKIGMSLLQTSCRFGNQYFKNLMIGRGLLHSDQELFKGGAGGPTDRFVRLYGTNGGAFASDFAAAMVRMGNLGVKTGNQGEIRLNCRRVN